MKLFILIADLKLYSSYSSDQLQNEAVTTWMLVNEVIYRQIS